MMYVPNVLGVDLSLTGAGIASLAETNEVHTFGRKGKNNEPYAMRNERANAIRESIADLLIAADAYDLAVFEGPSFGSVGGSAFDRAGLWWKVYDMLTSKGIPILVVIPNKVKIYGVGRATSRGENKVEKDEIFAAAIRRYPDIDIQNNNEADALLLAAIGRRMLGHPLEQTLPQTHLRALDGLVLP